MNIEKVIVNELKYFYPDIDDGEKMYSERVAKINAEELIEYSKQLTQKIFEATKQACVDNADIRYSHYTDGEYSLRELQQIYDENQFSSRVLDRYNQTCGVTVYDVDEDSILDIKIEDLEL